MIVEINYTALQWDNRQGGSGAPLAGRILREVDDEATLAELRNFAEDEINKESGSRPMIGDYSIINMIIDA